MFHESPAATADMSVVLFVILVVVALASHPAPEWCRETLWLVKWIFHPLSRKEPETL
jgi:hypothetical protein